MTALSRLTNTIGGDIQPTGIPTNMAISSEGYFVVADKQAGGDLYTRRGDFTPDKDGFLVNGAGFRLKGATIDPSTGKVGGSTEPVSTQPIPAAKMSEILYRANLPSKPATPAAVAAGAAATTADRLLPPAVAATLPGPVAGSAAFMDHSIAGGSLTLYDSLGSPIDVQLRWAKTDDVALGGASTDKWALLYRSSSTAPGTWRQAGRTVEFDANGRVIVPPSNVLPIASMVVDGTTIGGN